MKPRMSGEVCQGLPDVDVETMLSEQKRETDCKDYELVFSGPKNEEVINKTVGEFVPEQLPTDVDKAEPVISIKMEKPDDQCAAGIFLEARSVMPELETASCLQLKIKIENPRELSEKCSTECDSVVRSRANVVQQRSILRPSPSAPTKYCKIENETDGGNSLLSETKSENPKKADECGLGVSAEVTRLKLLKVLAEVTTQREECADHLAKQPENSRMLMAGEESKQFNEYLDFLVARAEKLKEAKEKRTLKKQREKRLTRPIERFQFNFRFKTAEEREKRVAVEMKRKAKESKKLENRKKCLERQKEKYRWLKANETPEQREERVAVEAEKRRQAKEKETPEQREKRQAAYVERQRRVKERETPEQRDERNERKKERYRRLRANETPEQREERLAVIGEKRRTETREQRGKRLAAMRKAREKQAAEYLRREEKIEAREAAQRFVERRLPRSRRCKPTDLNEELLFQNNEEELSRQRKAKEREILEQREKRNERQKERYRLLIDNETPEQRGKRLAVIAEEKRRTETPEQRKKRLAAMRKASEKLGELSSEDDNEEELSLDDDDEEELSGLDDDEKSDGRRAEKIDAREAAQRLIERRLPRPRRCKPTDLNEELLFQNNEEKLSSLNVDKKSERRNAEKIEAREAAQRLIERSLPRSRRCIPTDLNEELLFQNNEKELSSLNVDKKSEGRKAEKIEAREAAQRLIERSLPRSRRCKGMLKVVPTDINEEELSSEDDSEEELSFQDDSEEELSFQDDFEEELSSLANNFVKSEPIDEDEVDFSSHGANIISIKSEVVSKNEANDFSPPPVNQNFIKSEPVVAPAVEDEIEIDFEAVMETKMKIEPDSVI